MEKILHDLQKRKNENLYRVNEIVDAHATPYITIDNVRYINFSSNDYLGLANDPQVVSSFVDAGKQYGVGSGAAHLVTGHHRLHHALEESIAQFTNRSRALLFSSGYMANIGLLQALCGPKSVIFADKLNHASLIDGAKLSGAKLKRYAHSDMDRLESFLCQSNSAEKYIVSDGVFSMDGDTAKLKDILYLSKKYHANVIIDDAHGFGVLGENGRGICELHAAEADDSPILMGTLGKAFGTFGAFVVGSDVLIDWLIQSARSYVYTTAMPPAIAAASLQSLQIIHTQKQRRQHLHKLIVLFRSLASHAGLSIMPSETAIQPIIVGDEKHALEGSAKLRKSGFLVKAIRPPTVPKGTSRLRVTLSAKHSEQHITDLVAGLRELL